MEDTQIIKQVLQGNTDYFRLIVERYHIPVIRFVRNMISDNQICEDIAQDVFLTAYKKLSSFDPYYSKFSTWLFVIARNKSLNILKKKKPLSMEEVPEKIINKQMEFVILSGTKDLACECWVCFICK